MTKSIRHSHNHISFSKQMQRQAGEIDKAQTSKRFRGVTHLSSVPLPMVHHRNALASNSGTTQTFDSIKLHRVEWSIVRDSISLSTGTAMSPEQTTTMAMRSRAAAAARYTTPPHTPVPYVVHPLYPQPHPVLAPHGQRARCPDVRLTGNTYTLPGRLRTTNHSTQLKQPINDVSCIM